MHARKIISSMVIIAALLLIFIYLFHALALLAYPHQIDYGEGFILDSAVRLASGEELYPALNGPSARPSLYPPLFYSLYALLIGTCGISFAWGRLITLLSTFISAMLIFHMVRGRTKNAIVATAAFIGFLMSPIILEWGVIARVDMLGLLCSLLGAYLFLRGEGKRLMAAAALCYCLAIFTKQTFIAAPAATFLCLMLGGRKKEACAFSAWFLFFCSIAFLVMEMVSHRHFCQQVVGNFTVHSYSPARALHFVGLFSLYNVIVLSLSTLYCIPRLARRDIDFPLLYFLSSLTLAVLFAGKSGSYLNYFVEAVAAASITAALQCASLACDIKGARVSKTLTMIIIALVPFVLIVLCFTVYFRFMAFDSIIAKRKPELDALSRVVRNIDGRVLSEDAGLLVLNGKSKDIIEFLYLKELLRARRWDQAALVSDIRDGRFSLIVLNFELKNYEVMGRAQERFTPEMAEAMKKSYRIDERLCLESGRYCYYLYRPGRK
jgi:hypothetical protein